MNQSRRTPPLPSPVFVPLYVDEQKMLPGFSGKDHDEGLYQFEQALSDGLIATAHAYGVTVKRVDLVYFGPNVYATLTLEAGMFKAQKTFGASRQKHPVSRLCSNLLRYLRHENRKMG